jgi:hypothetical protein
MGQGEMRDARQSGLAGAISCGKLMEMEQQRSPLCGSHREEMASSVTHALGLVFSVGALIAMLLVAGTDGLRLVSAVVFGVSLVMLYLSSTLYHLFTGCRVKAFFQMLDHVCIYLLIAGSYTPLTLVTLKGPWGWTLFGIVGAEGSVVVDGFVSWNGLAGGAGVRADGEAVAERGGSVAGGGWFVLYGWGGFFHMAAIAISSCDLASFRVGWQCVPCAGDVFVYSSLNQNARAT